MPRTRGPIRVGVTALGRRIMAGFAARDNQSFIGNPSDVTSDVLKAIGDYVGVGKKADVTVNGEVAYTIYVVASGGQPPETVPDVNLASVATAES